jgi:hypothetical protein
MKMNAKRFCFFRHIVQNGGHCALSGARVPTGGRPKLHALVNHLSKDSDS